MGNATSGTWPAPRAAIAIELALRRSQPWACIVTADHEVGLHLRSVGGKLLTNGPSHRRDTEVHLGERP